MNRRKQEEEKARTKYNRGRRLLENEDFKKYLDDIDEEWAVKVKALMTTPTTDPVIAKLQAEVQTLESTRLRAKSWIEDYAAIRNEQQQGQPVTEDYDKG